MRKLLLFIFSYAFLSAFALENTDAQYHQIDSLKLLLKNDRDDSSKVNHLNALSYALRTNKPDSAILIATKATTLAKAIKFQVGEANSYRNEGMAYSVKGDYIKALEYYHKALTLCQQIDNKNGIATNLSSVGSIYYIHGDYPKALDFQIQSLQIAENIGSKQVQASALSNIGNIYKDQGDYSRALECYMKCLAINKQTGNKNGIASNLGNIGTIYDYQAGAANLTNGASDSLYKTALDYYSNSLKIGEELGNKIGIIKQLGNIGETYKKEAEACNIASKRTELYNKAVGYFFRALKMAQETGNKTGIALNLGNIGSLYTKTGKYDEAEEYLKKSIALADTIGAKDNLCQFEEYLSQLYSATGRYQLALNEYHKTMVLKDSLFSANKSNAMMHKELSFQFEKKEAAEKAEQDKKEALAEQEKKRQILIRNALMVGFALMLALAFFIFRSYRQKQKANVIITRQKEEVEKQKEEVEQKNQIIEHQKNIVDEKNKDITDSIQYASRIQRALLTTDEYINRHLKDYFILFKPRDIVSGDFYWTFSSGENDKVFHIACCDCTGHGVPGAFMSLLNISLLNETVVERKITRPDLVLNEVRTNIIKALNPKGSDTESKDGMDCIYCSIDLETKTLNAACANNSLWIIKHNDKSVIKEFAPDKMPVGIQYGEQKPFTLHSEQVAEGDCVYLFSDGYADQFGGAKGKKFKYKQLGELLVANSGKSMAEQKKILEETFENWKGGLEQVDDVLVIGLRI
ncbi:MAG: tetratricopeptide repeat protein [Bacteroidia bacterium]